MVMGQITARDGAGTREGEAVAETIGFWRPARRAIMASLHLAALAGAVFLAAPAEAGPAMYGPPGQDGYQWITVNSERGQDSISAPVRMGANGYEVRLPGGGWIYCAANCFNTLRNATIDFWHRDNAFSGD